MKRHFVLGRWGLAAGLCLLLVGVLTVSLGWATASSSTPASGASGSSGEAAPQARPLTVGDPGQAAPSASARPSRFLETSKVSAAEAVRRAWERTRDAGVYRFATDLVQTTYPALSLSNAGRGPRHDATYLEGQIDMPARTMRMSLREGGAAANSRNGGEARIEDGRAYVRGFGGEWQEVEDFSTSFAPDSDLLAYLAGMKNVREVSAEKRRSGAAEEQRNDSSRSTLHVSRFTFDLDGPAFATYMRDQLESELRENGELPLNLTLDVARQFRDVTGDGEIWIDGRGYPLRLMVHLVYPKARNGSHVEAAITTDFSGFPARGETRGGGDTERGRRSPRLPLSASPYLPQAGGAGGALACGLGVTVLLLACRRSRRLYTAVVIAVVFSMVIVPLMQTERATAYFERQAGRRAELEESQQTQRATQAALTEQMAPAWDPHRDPLAQPALAQPETVGRRDAAVPPLVSVSPHLPVSSAAPQVTPTPTPPPDSECDASDADDGDNDGLTDYQECLLESDPTNPDSDYDGLSDGQEVSRLATDAMAWDTDGDAITDTLEVQGLYYAGQRWYLDPKNADSNSDGLIDSLDCPPLVEGVTSGDRIATECDTDGDEVIDLFDADNDNDGVPDRLDISPRQVVDRAGVHSTADDVIPADTFTDIDPFKLIVQGLQTGMPAFVDLQLRPENPDHLAYIRNVLDWPEDDLDGQIQHVKPTTFQDSDNPDIANPDDDAGGHGDIRLVPLLEIEMSGSSIPLKWMDPAVTATVENTTAFSATVVLTQQSATDPAKYDTVLHFTFQDGASHKVEIYNGSCAALDTVVKTYTSVASKSSVVYNDTLLAELADGQHAIVVPDVPSASPPPTSGEGQGVGACGDIPGVVPMPHYDDKIVDLSVLAPYGISVKQATADTLVAYVPLNLVTDDTGGGKAAFSARMLYWPGDENTWGTAQPMRVLWLVEALADYCEEEGFEPTVDEEEDPDKYDEEYDAWCETHRTQDELQVVQTYPESWYVTGLAVREDHGLDVAIAYENPAKPYTDEDLWELSWGLGQSFIPQRDCEITSTLHTDPNPGTCHVDGLRDLTVYQYDRDGIQIGNETIAQVFDAESPIKNSVTITERLGLAADALRVENFRYPTEDYMSYLAMTETPRILAQFPTSVAPSLLFAREEHYRSAGLEAVSGTGKDVLTLQVGIDVYKPKTLTGMSWAPFHYNPNAGEDGEVIGWETYPIEDYVYMLDDDLRALFISLYPDDTSETTDGRVVTAESYYLAMLNGIESDVPLSGCPAGEEECPFPTEEGESYETIIVASEKFTSRFSHVTTEVAAEIYEAYHSEWVMYIDQSGGTVYAKCPVSGQPSCTSFFDAMGESMHEFFISPLNTLFREGTIATRVSGTLLAAAAVTAVALMIVTLLNSDTTAEAVAAVVTTLTTVIAVAAAASAISSYVKFVTKNYQGMTLKEITQWDLSHAGFHAKENKAGIVALVIHIAVTWAAWGISWAVNNLQFGSMAWDNSLATTIAATITAVVMFVLLATVPFGKVIAAVIAVVDALAAQLCNAFLSEEQKETRWAQAVCGGITGMVTAFYKRVLYSGTLIADMDPDEDKGLPWYPRVQFSGYRNDLVHPELGVTEGNEILPSISLTNTIDLANPPIAVQEAYMFWQFSQGNLETSSFTYKWQNEEEEIHEHLDRNGMPDPGWQEWKGDLPVYFITDVVGTEPIPLPEVGINKPVENMVLSEGYALPEQECWGWVFKYCFIDTEKATVHFPIGENLKFDVLPATFDDFYSLERRGDGFALDWDEGFEVLYDADGDGVPATADPNDKEWDSDGDGLSDFYEQETGSDPTLLDTDHDGLTDYQEALYFSDPANEDSDGDGLLDCEEVYHPVLAEDHLAVCGSLGAWRGGWTVVYGMADNVPLETRVTSNLTSVDTDGDGLTDFQERTYGYNPRAYSVLNVLNLRSDLSEVDTQGVKTPSDGFVAPGQTLYYSATVVNELDNRQAEGLLSIGSDTSDVFMNEGVAPQSFVLAPQRQQNITGDIAVDGDAATGVYSLTQVAGAVITDLTVESDDAALWLRFDDPAASTVYADSSGRIPAHDGRCGTTGGCSLDTLGGRFGGGIVLDGTKGYVEVPLDVSETAYALSLWFKTTCTNCGIFSVDSGVLGAGGHDRHVYLSDGNVCARVYSSEIKCTSGKNWADGGWHQVIHTYGGSAGGQKIYLDGVLEIAGTKAASDFTWQDGINIGFSNDAVQDYFSGSIDDVRIFNRGLTPGEVADLANQPVFHMDFNSSSAWQDVSSFNAPIADCGTHCPSHTTTAIAGQAAKFNGTQYLNVPAAAQLNLSGGQLTMAAWIRPESRGASVPFATEGVIGLKSGEKDAYPSLQRIGRKIRFSFGTGSAWLTPYVSGDVLTEGQWSHVAVVYNINSTGSQLRLYINGALVDTKSFSAAALAPTTSIDIGRSSNTGNLYIQNYHQTHSYDSMSTCGAWMTAEMCMAINGQEVMHRNFDCDQTYNWGLNYAVTGPTTLQLWESDPDGDPCNSAPNGDDDTCTLSWDSTSGTSIMFTTNDSGAGAITQYNFGHCGDGYFNLSYTNNANPFNGDIDEVLIYNQALTDDELKTLYIDTVTALHLPLDEAPGAHVFTDTSLARRQASCTGDTCPTSGVDGRMDRAVWLDGVNDNVRARSFGDFTSTTASAWVYRTKADTARQTIVSYKEDIGCGFVLAVENNVPKFWVSAGGAWRGPAVGSTQITPNQWAHLAGAYDGSTITVYLNGTVAGTATYSGSMKNGTECAAGTASIGSRSDNKQHWFPGVIDDVWIFSRSLSKDRIVELYESAPLLHLRFDEAHGTSQFADDAHYGRTGACTGNGCPLTGEAVEGQIGLAAQFDGVDDRVKIADSPELRLPKFSVGAWVMPMTFTHGIQYDPTPEMISKWGPGPTGKAISNFELRIRDDLTPQLDFGCPDATGYNGIFVSVPAANPLILDHWNHLMGTYDGKTLRIYVNGAEAGSRAATPPAGVTCTSDAPIEIGGKEGMSTYEYFTGRLDEVAIYKNALSASQIREMYLYQGGWAEDRQSRNITVDDKPPSATLEITGTNPYRPGGSTVVVISAEDADSRVDRVVLSAQRGSAEKHSFDAQPCGGSGNDNNWCASFEPWGSPPDQTYTLQATATDAVGNSGSSETKSVRVDDTAPSPLTIAATEMQRFDANPAQGDPEHWVISLSGTVKDPALPDGAPGSGIPSDGVTVTLRTPDGGVLGNGSQTASISGDTWSVQYDFTEPQPSGCYDVQVGAVDNLVRMLDLDPDQRARHTATESQRISLDADPPAVQLDWTNLAGGQIGPTLKTLGGETNSRPVPVEVDWTTNADGALASLSISCQHGNGDWYTVYTAAAGSFEANTTYPWSSEDKIHQGSACKVTLAASGSTGVASGLVKVCGAQIASWTTERTVSFTATSSACGADTCGAGLKVAGVKGVDIAYTSMLPGSAFVNEAPPTGEVLHLTLDDGPTETGGLSFSDASGTGLPGACTGTGCPAPGQPGHLGSAALFDGADDVLRLGRYTPSNLATVSAWVRPTGATNTRETIVSMQENSGCGFVLDLKNGTNSYPEFYISYLDSTSHYGWRSISQSVAVSKDRWTHLAGVYDGSYMYLYRDGELVAQSGSLPGRIYDWCGAQIGVGARSDYLQHFFPGQLDDVRIFNRGLSAAEIKALYRGSGPLLALPFEASWATGGTNLPDDSGWGHDGTLQTGTSDTANKAVTGQVGAYALHLDGVNDYISVGPDAGLDLSGGQFTEAAWINSEATDTNYHGIMGYQPPGNNLAQRYASMWVYQKTSIVGGFGDGTNWNYFLKSGALQTGWNHVAMTFDGASLKLYVNGTSINTTTSFSGRKPYAGTKQLEVGKADIYTFKGSIDDARVYARALSAAEIGDLYHAGWQAASLLASGDAVESTKWTANVPSGTVGSTTPPGLEGAYRIDLRSTDVAGHTGAARDREALWNGDADTLPPRVTLTKKVVNATYQYTTVAEDYNLVETGLSSPCGTAGTITREYFKSPWYVTSGGAQKLYRLTLDCTLTSQAANETAQAYDSYNNYTTAGVTAAAAETAGGREGATRGGRDGLGVSVSPSLRVDPGRGKPKFEITLNTTVLTTTHYYEPGTIDLTGLVTAHNDPDRDRHALAGLQVTVGGVTGPAILSEPAEAEPYTVTWRFPWRLPARDALPDGLSYTAVLTATDSAGRTTPKSVDLLADVVPPAPVTVTLRSGGVPLRQGAVVRTPSPELVLTWTPSSDGGGLAGYTTTWTVRSAETTTVTSRAHDAVGVLEDRLTGGEAQQITAALGSRDRYGNERWQSTGPVYADTPLTPDYIDLPSPGVGRGAGGEGYTGWMDSGCTLLGADRRLQWNYARYGARRAPQRLYAAWDSRALRLAWTGANWSADGDLFIYLDIGPGGTGSVFTPHSVPTDNGVYLTAADADRVVWVRGSSNASLHRWDGAAWITDTLLTDAEYRFNPSLRDGQTDLYLPFALLGTDPSSVVGVLAFAAEDHVPGARLQVWSVVPRFNLLNSRRVNPMQVFAPEGGVAFGLSHPYTWDGLGEGICPNGTHDGALNGSTGDADLQLDITSDPAGLVIGGPRGGIFWLPDPGEVAALLPNFLHVGQPPLKDGQEILYTVRYRNSGVHAATGVWLKLNALGPMRMLDESVTLGDIPPGAVGEATFRAIVDRSVSDWRLAGVAGLVYDAAHGADGPTLEWLLAIHRVDQGAPEPGSLNLEYLGRTVGPDSMVLNGYAHDESGVRDVKLEVTAPSGRVSVLDCPIPRPVDGRWSCAWDVTASNGGVPPVDGEQFSLRLQATDRFGHTGEWIGPWTVRVDARPPAVAVDAAALRTLRGGLVRGDGLTLFGDVHDPDGVGAVQVCLEEKCATAELQGAGALRWSHRTPELGRLDYVTRTFTIQAFDRHGNRTVEPLAVPVTFDNVAPVLSVAQVADQAVLGSRQTVLNGTVTDGGPSASVSVRVQPPNGDVTRSTAARAGETWWFELPADLPGRYTLWVDGEDLAGNASTAGPFTVDVTCTDAAPVVGSLTAEPVAGFPMSLTLTAVISNTGPDLLPAGIPVVLNESAGAIGSVTTTLPLSAGESQALSLVWAPDGARDHEIVGQIANLSYPLCATPPPAHFLLPMRDLPLYTAWNLISPPVNPSNTDVQVVQRGVSRAYTAILGYDGGPLAYYPDRPQDSTLSTVDALHGYWVKTTAPPDVPPEDLQGDEQVAAWRMAGPLLPEGQPLFLSTGWNLAGYLPRRPLTVTTALRSIEGRYGAVLGFERTALSYYPDLDASYNTLYRMAPGYGYWIHAREALTLSYPLSVVTETVPFTPSLALEDWQARIRLAEWEAGVRPAVEWMNFYGKATLPDKTGVPTGTVVLALDPQGVICGATVVREPGQYGLLACYRDDPDTEADEGATPGDTIRLLLAEGTPPQPGSWLVGEGTWTAHGARRQVPAGPPPDLPYRSYLPLLLVNAEGQLGAGSEEPAVEEHPQ